MTKLIPLDAAIAVLAHDRIRMNVSGTEFRVISTQDHIDAIRAIPTIDPAAIREAAAVVEREIEQAKQLMPVIVPILRGVHRDILALIQKGADNE